MVAPSSKFYGKMWVGFCLNTGKCFFHFKANRKSIGSSRKHTRDFQNSPLFERTACFRVTAKILIVLNSLTLKQIF